jgi:hypothetical protein
MVKTEVPAPNDRVSGLKGVIPDVFEHLELGIDRRSLLSQPVMTVYYPCDLRIGPVGQQIPEITRWKVRVGPSR